MPSSAATVSRWMVNGGGGRILLLGDGIGGILLLGDGGGSMRRH